MNQVKKQDLIKNIYIIEKILRKIKKKSKKEEEIFVIKENRNIQIRTYNKMT